MEVSYGAADPRHKPSSYPELEYRPTPKDVRADGTEIDRGYEYMIADLMTQYPWREVFGLDYEQTLHLPVYQFRILEERIHAVAKERAEQAAKAKELDVQVKKMEAEAKQQQAAAAKRRG